MSGWKLANAIEEYKVFAEPKVRECDINYIASFDLVELSSLFEDRARTQLRARNFVRLTWFACFVLALWLVSGSKFLSTRRKLDF